MNTKNLLIDALESRYEATMKECVATLHIYTNNSVGVGEHPNITDELDNLLTKYADAEGKLTVLKKMKDEL